MYVRSTRTYTRISKRHELAFKLVYKLIVTINSDMISHRAKRMASQFTAWLGISKTNQNLEALSVDNVCYSTEMNLSNKCEQLKCELSENSNRICFIFMHI